MSGRPLRVAFLVRAFPTVSETFIRDQVDGLRERGHSVDVYSLYRGAGSPVAENEAGRSSEDTEAVRYLLGPELSLSGALLRAARRTLSAVRHPFPLLRLGPVAVRHPRVAAEAVHAIPLLASAGGNLGDPYDIIHAHYGPTGLLGLALRRAELLSGPLVTTFHGVDLSRYPSRRGRDCYAWLFADGEAFTVNSAFAESRATALGAPPDRLHRLPVGAPVDRIPFELRRPPNEGPLRLLSVGRLEEVKGISFGLRAVGILQERGIDLRYTIVGSGRLETSLRGEATRLGVRSVVDFAGALPFDEVIREYGKHHLFMMPGIRTADDQAETQGRVLVEAQAAGLPIVASRVGGIPETVGPGVGILVPPGDAPALAEAVIRLLKRPGDWESMARKGRNHVEARYDQDLLLDKLLQIYRRVGENRVGRKEEAKA